jgi:hypothetical protein
MSLRAQGARQAGPGPPRTPRMRGPKKEPACTYGAVAAYRSGAAPWSGEAPTVSVTSRMNRSRPYRPASRGPLV